jgi:hypothetical protein
MKAHLLLLVFSALSRAVASDSPIIDLVVKPAQVNVGEEVVATVIYRWPAGWTPHGLPDPSGAFQNLFATAFPPVQKTRTGERQQLLYSVSLLAQRSGAWALPRVTWQFTGPNGDETVQGPEVIVQVGTDASPAKLPGPRPLWTKAESVSEQKVARWWPAALLAAGAAVAAVLWFRRASAVPQTTPFQGFLRDSESCLTSGDGKEGGARLSLALRRYCGATWRFDGPGSTTRELSRSLKQHLKPDEHSLVMHIVEELDALRWGPDDLPVSSIQGLLARTKQWVDMTQKRLDEEAAQAEAGKKAS